MKKKSWELNILCIWRLKKKLYIKIARGAFITSYTILYRYIYTIKYINQLENVPIPIHKLHNFTMNEYIDGLELKKGSKFY